MQNSKINNIIFDLGGVLIDWDPRNVYKKIFSSETEMEDFLTNVCNTEWVLKQDAGQTLEEGTKMLCALHPDKSELIEAYYQRWHEMINGEISGTVEILNQLEERKFKLYALTNWSRETFPYAKNKFKFLHTFLDIVVSGEEKIIKPNKKIYEILLTRNNLKANESVFIDDNIANIEAAKSLGITAIQFISAPKLAKDLQKIGVL
ncbi:MAG: HAD family phosphatase [Gammaproteobacteria bacterium]|nr:HAD family phosphatase [Gammaproteobacteria bacterium]